jgi:hypothetical protein
MDVEEHVCQSCGEPLDPDSEMGEFCTFCTVHPDRGEVLKKVAEKIECDTGKSMDECMELAEKQISPLSRWK